MKDEKVLKAAFEKYRDEAIAFTYAVAEFYEKPKNKAQRARMRKMMDIMASQKVSAKRYLLLDNPPVNCPEKE